MGYIAVIKDFLDIGGFNLVVRGVYAKIRSSISEPYSGKDWAKLTYNSKQQYYMNTGYPSGDRLLRHNLGVEEPQVTAILDEYLTDGDVAVDIGSQCGGLSFYMHSLVGQTGDIHCFEPTEEWFDILNKNIEKNSLSNVYPNKMAVSKRSGNDSPTNVVGGGHKIINEFSNKTENIETVSLEDYFSNKSNGPDLVKIDVDGMEFDVLRGMEKYIGKIPIVLELHAINLLDNWNETTDYIQDRAMIIYLGTQGMEENEFQHKSSIDIKELSSSNVHHLLLK